MTSTRLLDFILGSPGIVLDYAGATAPAGFLLCYGQIVNIADYPMLFAAIGAVYGGNGTTTFGIPDCRGRAAAGKDNMGGVAAGRMTAAGGLLATTLGTAGGAETHVLTTAQMPAHNHAITDPGHVHSGPTNNSGSSPGGGGQLTGNASVNTGSSATGISIQNNGGGGAHPNVQPSIVLNKIIKT